MKISVGSQTRGNAQSDPAQCPKFNASIDRKSVENITHIMHDIVTSLPWSGAAYLALLLSTFVTSVVLSLVR